jgi:putative copper export protein
VPDVALHTRIGQILLAKGLLLLATCLLVRRAQPQAALALPFALGGMVAPVAASHAASLEDPVLVSALALHLVAAAAWLGGLAPLWQVVADPARSLAQRRQAVLRFSRLGLGAVLLLAVTAVIQVPRLAGDLAGLLGTPYGQTLLSKTALFLLLLGLAALNRFLFTPRMAWDAGLAGLRRSILAEIALGMAVVAVAVLLSSTPPALHQQPVWPFALRAENWRWEPPLPYAPFWLVPMFLALVSWWQPGPRRGFAGAAMLLPLSFVAAGLRVELVPATPTSFQTAPAGFSVDAILRGEALAAADPSMRVPPSGALTEGDAFWFAGQAAPGLAPMERWDVAAFLHAAQAGEQVRRDGGWTRPLQAPDMSLLCGNGRGTTLAALRGTVLRIAAGFAPAVDGALTISLDRAPATGMGCVATDAAARRVYALLAGVPEDGSTGLWVLVDGHGWLRGSGLNTIPDVLEEAARAIGAAPLAEGRAHH